MQAFYSVFALFLALLLYHISPCLAILTGYFVREERLFIDSIVNKCVDYIAVNGDILYAEADGNSIYNYIEHSPQNLRYSLNAVHMLSSLTNIAPVLFSTGNHELYLDDEDRSLLHELGVILLDDTFV